MTSDDHQHQLSGRHPATPGGAASRARLQPRSLPWRLQATLHLPLSRRRCLAAVVEMLSVALLAIGRHLTVAPVASNEGGGARAARSISRDGGASPDAPPPPPPPLQTTPPPPLASATAAVHSGLPPWRGSSADAVAAALRGGKFERAFHRQFQPGGQASSAAPTPPSPAAARRWSAAVANATAALLRAAGTELAPQAAWLHDEAG